MIGNTVEEVADTGVAYFVDEEGRYYYQPADDDQNIVSLPMVTEDTVEVPKYQWFFNL